ncbi:hypothetical protein NIES593_06140 [Hydrococcus rivularis NIES-593]|uniref:Uncharacterized protein n=1 Tax=Hydrococcus rivularis NIES-593 TaxID=1921803 RepID=A0A1U7HMP9_9CYAN|nr:hypothetical protein [Hydrococcus rivularis]OKH24795.1 hypothetical protein NIES593_06140 [Hydrococcus rivularis NIES-593]
MGDFDNIGKLMHLPLEDIKPSDEFFTAPEFIVNAAAAAVKTEGRNWVPLIVKEIAEYQYQVVSNPLVYEVAQKAGLERVWCIVIDPKPENIEQAKILTGATKPRVNLNTASRETILAALKYLIEEPNSALKGVDVIIATQKIAEAKRESWKNFNEITKLKCGITQGKKLEALKEVFFLSPSPKAKLPPLPEPVSIKRASRDEIFERLNYLFTWKIDRFDTINPDKAADIIFTASKSKWKSLNPISKLNCGLNQAQIKTLKIVFSL